MKTIGGFFTIIHYIIASFILHLLLVTYTNIEYSAEISMVFLAILVMGHIVEIGKNMHRKWESR